MVPDIEIRQLSVWFDTAQGPVKAVDGLSTTFRAGRISGVIGESGSGKSVMGMSLLRLLPNTARVTGECWFGGQELYSMPLRELRKLRGAAIGLIPQNPNASLDPVMKLKKQLTEAIIAHGGKGKKGAEARAAELLRQFGFEEPERILGQYAFQMSGGMNQRLVSALGLACQPGWVIADEPTKGLDAVLRRQVCAVLRQIHLRHHSSMLLITHDLELARRLCEDLLVLYMGKIIDQGRTLLQAITARRENQQQPDQTLPVLLRLRLKQRRSLLRRGDRRPSEIRDHPFDLERREVFGEQSAKQIDLRFAHRLAAFQDRSDQRQERSPSRQFHLVGRLLAVSAEQSNGTGKRLAQRPFDSAPDSDRPGYSGKINHCPSPLHPSRSGSGIPPFLRTRTRAAAAGVAAASR